MKKIIYIALGICLTFSAKAQIDRSQQPKPGPAPTVNINQPQTFKLANGLDVLVVENHKLPSVGMYLTLDNPPHTEGAKNGMYTLTSLLMGNGTTSTSKDVFNDKIALLGANINFGISQVSANTLSRYFPQVLDLMAEGALHPLFTSEELESQRAQLLDGLKTEEKDVPTIAGRVYNALSFGKEHPNGEFLTEKTIKNVTLDDVKTCYTSAFAPNKAYLVIVGDVKFNDVKKLVTEKFTDWKKVDQLPGKNYTDPTPLTNTEIDVVDVPTAVQTEVRVGNTMLLKLSDPDYFAASLANQILGRGSEGRLFLNLREAHAWTYGAYSNLGSGKYLSTFTASSAMRNSVVDSAVVQIQKELTRIKTTPVTEDELKFAKAQYTGSFVMSVEKPSTVAFLALREKTQSLPNDFYQNYIKNINAVTLEQVQAAAKKYFLGTRIVLVGKTSEFSKGLERLNLPIHYFDKYASPTQKVEELKMDPNVTVQSVLMKYINAIGGKANLESVKTKEILYSGSIQGAQLSLTNKVTSKGEAVQEMSVNGNVMVKTVYDGKTGYTTLQGQKKILEGDELKDAKGHTFDELDFLTNPNVKLAGMDRIDNKTVYRLVNGDKAYLYDIQTGLKLAEEENKEIAGKPNSKRLMFSDYKEVKGIKIPYKLTMEIGPGASIDMTVTSVKFNEGVSSSDFK